MVALMTLDTLAALILFAFASSITPGPNNVMLLASGANFGFAPDGAAHAGHLGRPCGDGGAGGGWAFWACFTALPWLRTGLTVVSVAYLLWLAWKIANAGTTGRGRGEGPSR